MGCTEQRYRQTDVPETSFSQRSLHLGLASCLEVHCVLGAKSCKQRFTSLHSVGPGSKTIMSLSGDWNSTRVKRDKKEREREERERERK